MKIPTAELAVIWRKGGRVGSIHQNELPVLKKDWSLFLMQTDVSGCQHWNVLGAR